MDKLANLFVVSVIMLTVAGCFGNASAIIRCRVFETSLDAVDEVVPRENRKPLGDSGYWAVYLSGMEVLSLLMDVPSNHGLLVDKLIGTSEWTGISDTWAYAYSYDIAEGEITGGRGTGAGLIGVRYKGTSCEIRIKYVIRHHFDECKPIQSEVTYEGNALNEGIVFIRPMECKEGTNLAHIVAFEIYSWK